ncbi:hypothetical protein [Bacillus thuringiensis]|uniref:hypothetical protein n=1 Tax=Bacillus thuringiensis TaxID=1428 RepID=UPI000BFDA9C4|nr:hypothetical protein [Bacillus thuringiensis]PGT89795.1 hypothetical protein COD17_08575 [Bacillus thuringiensis]
MRKTDVAVKVFFDGIRKGLSEEEAYQQEVFENQTVRDVCKEAYYRRVFRKTVKEIQESKARKGRMSWVVAQKVIGLFFRSNGNEWATCAEMYKFMDYIMGTTKNSRWGHVDRMHQKYGRLERLDREGAPNLYRLSEKWFREQGLSAD